MKYRKISFDGHPILGSVVFDFTDSKSNTVNTIILAGENGCGKTVLLDFLSSYNPLIQVSDFNLHVEVELSDLDLEVLMSKADFRNIVQRDFSERIVTFIHDPVKNSGGSYVEFNSVTGVSHRIPGFYFANGTGIFKSVYSGVEINFRPEIIRSISSYNIDTESNSSIRSSANLATEIKQLLIDIDTLDSNELSRWVDAHLGEAPGDDIRHKRIRRFTNAFNQMFPHKRYLGIDNGGDQKLVLFEEFGKKMELNQLSSGEKQIVFRGGFLLRNLGSTSGAPILIDEPELSLHPRWQMRILGFIKGLFTDDSGKQLSQVIVATHSPFIIHNETRSDDKVIVLQRDDEGHIKVLDKPEYYNWSESSTVEDAFSVSSFSGRDLLTVFVEGETDEFYYRKAQEVFHCDKGIVFDWIGRCVGPGRNENSGSSALNSAANFIKANQRFLMHSKVYLLYDCDTNKPEGHEGSLFIGSMSHHDESPVYKKGIENLLKLPEDFKYGEFYKESIEVNDYGARSLRSDLDKTKLAQWVGAQSEETLREILENLKLEIDHIVSRVGLS